MQENKTKTTKNIEVRAIGKPSITALSDSEQQVFYTTLQGIYRNGKPLAMNTVYNILRCERYTGVYRKGEEVIDNMYPAIIPQDLFDSVQAILKTYQHGKNSIEVTYLLRNKLKCGYCGQSIIGECGTAKNGERKYYYKCRGRKMKLNDCKKSAMSKDDLEHLIIDTVISELKNTQAIENAVKYLIELQNNNANENRLLNAYIKEQKDNERAINNIVANMERGIVAKATSKRLSELEERQEELERLILIEQSKQTVSIAEALCLFYIFVNSPCSLSNIEGIKKAVRFRSDRPFPLL